MSAEDTNLETQKKQHAGPIVGIKLVVGAVVLGFVIFIAIQFLRGDEPEGAAMQVEGTTGAVVEN